MSYTELKKLFKEQSILSDINGMLNWDMATYMPPNSRSQRVDQIKTIYEYKKRIFEIIKQKQWIYRQSVPNTAIWRPMQKATNRVSYLEHK